MVEALLSSPFMANLAGQAANGIGQGLAGGKATSEVFSPMDGSNWTANINSAGASGATTAAPLGVAGAGGSSVLWIAAAAVAAFLILRRRRGSQ